MTRYMADSTDCRQITSTVAVPGVGVRPISLRCGYVGGSFEQSSHACGPVDVNIDVDATHPSADVLDIETGDATPASAPAWVEAHNAQSSYPGVLYCNRSTIHAVANALAAAGLQVVKDYRWWIAILDGRIDPNTGLPLDIPDMTGVTAVQAWSANYFPNNIDLSIVYDDAWKASNPVSSPTADAAAVWQTSIARQNADGTVWQNYALQELADVKTLLLGLSTPHGETNGIVSAILNALPGIVNDAVKAAFAANVVQVQVTVNGKPVP